MTLTFEDAMEALAKGPLPCTQAEVRLVAAIVLWWEDQHGVYADMVWFDDDSNEALIRHLIDTLGNMLTPEPFSSHKVMSAFYIAMEVRLPKAAHDEVQALIFGPRIPKEKLN